MKTYPSSDMEWAEYAKLNSDPWMLDALKLNPKDVDWGVDESDRKNIDWPWPPETEDWADFLGKTDDSKECVHFYFGIDKIEKNAYLSLTLWLISPKKGNSLKVKIKRVLEKELPEIHRWLSQADIRNMERFSSLAARNGLWWVA